MGYVKNGMSSTVTGKIGNETKSIRKASIDAKYMRDFKSNERKPIQIASIQSGQNVVRGGGKVSSMTVKSGKGVMKLNKPLKSSKAHKEMQRDATEREDAERNEHNTGSTTT